MTTANLSPHSFSHMARGILIFAACIIIIAGMRTAESMLVPFFLSCFIAIICAPPLFWLQHKGIPGPLALLIIILVVLLLGGSLAALIGSSIKDFSAQLPEYQARLQDEFTALLAWFGSFGIEVFDKTILEYFNPGAAMRLVANTLAGFGSVLTNAFLILLTVAFILMEATSFPAKLKSIFSDANKSIDHVYQVMDDIKRYMLIKTMASIATGLFIYFTLWLIGVDYALLWGVLAFLLNFVPNIGSIIAAVPAVLLALVQLGVGAAVLSATAYVAVNIIIGNFIEPRFMGKSLGLSTLVVFLSLVFWGWILGPVGMLLSVPLTMGVKIALQSSQQGHWLAVILGPALDVEDQDSEEQDAEKQTSKQENKSARKKPVSKKTSRKKSASKKWALYAKTWH